jgi:hypothetical protein
MYSSFSSFEPNRDGIPTRGNLAFSAFNRTLGDHHVAESGRFAPFILCIGISTVSYSSNIYQIYKPRGAGPFKAATLHYHHNESSITVQYLKSFFNFHYFACLFGSYPGPPLELSTSCLSDTRPPSSLLAVLISPLPSPLPQNHVKPRRTCSSPAEQTIQTHARRR